MANILIIKVIPSATAHAAHNPSVPKILDISNMQAESAANVRIPDNTADTVPYPPSSEINF